MSRPIPILSQPGIKRDGTRFSGDHYVDGQWVRFVNGLPRKIGGYRRLTRDVGGIIRQFHAQARDNFVYTHAGSGSLLEQFTIDINGNASAVTNRTPSGFDADDSNGWQFDAIYDGGDLTAMALIAHAARNASDISDATNGPVYIGDYWASTPLTAISGVSVSGGVVVLHPYLMAFGNDGLVKWSDAGLPDQFTGGDSGEARIASTKIVRGLRVRGGSATPAGLLWSLDSLIRASYVGGTSIFDFDTIAETSVLSSNGIIEYDGVYYWPGLDRFQSFNGVQREVPNNLSTDFFFDNMNYLHANKTFAVKVPRYGEIWWCFPKGQSTEPDHALILNLREQTWYDTELPNGGRSAGIYAQVFRSPLLAGVELAPARADSETLITEAGDTLITEDEDTIITDNGPTNYRVWRHEVGHDEIEGSDIRAIQSFIETNEISLLSGDDPKSSAIRIDMMEPDFLQTGDLTVQMIGRANARADDVNGDIRTITADAASAAEENVFPTGAARLLRFRFSSNTVGGHFEMGRVFAHVQANDARTQS